MSNLVFEEKTVESEKIYEGKIINLRRDTVTTINGQSVREIVEHKGGAVIVALKDNGNVLMVRQFRKPIDDVILEVPAGKIDPGENPAETAARELREETGYRASSMKFLTRMYPSVGFSDEALYIYFASELSAGETDFDDNEAIDIEEYPLSQLYEMVLEGKIQDGKSQVAILMVKGLLEEGKLQGYLK